MKRFMVDVRTEPFNVKHFIGLKVSGGAYIEFYSGRSLLIFTDDPIKTKKEVMEHMAETEHDYHMKVFDLNENFDNSK